MEENKKSWGGARKGSGKKRMGDVPRVTMAATVEPQTKEIFKAKADELGISVGVLIDRLAKTL